MKPILLIERLHLTYLGLLPALATFAIVWTYGASLMWLLFIGGIAAVSVYLAFIASYIPPPKSVKSGLFLLLDGPTFVLLSLFNGGAVLAFAVESFLVDGTAVWLAILALSLTSSLPTPGQRGGSVIIMLIALLATFFLCWSYISDQLWGDILKLFWLTAGVLEGVVARFVLLEKERVYRQTDFSMMYIIIFLFIWLFALFSANIFRG